LFFLGSISNEIPCICTRECTTCDNLWSDLFSRKSVFKNFIFFTSIFSIQLVKSDDLIENKLNKDDTSNNIPHTPCPEFSKFLYFLFAPTLIYRDSYPRTSSVRWKYVISNLAQFATTTLFAYYLFYRFCLPVFSHFNSEHVTVKIFVLSILNCTLPGALVLFCGKLRRRPINEIGICSILFFSILWVSSLLAQCICGNASFC
jgi:hypothetical protein